ncbi:phosphonate ABC transporter ATP-binding protein [Nocardiopsis synnemataformans]|uniref:phosphonate ABC transporter ATP-binding protein n=1 Tax=Nocardiopsis synnemataformans TaxID=61305 RepID=UPI003EBF5DB8
MTADATTAAARPQRTDRDADPLTVPVVSVRGLTVVYDTAPVLDGVDLDVAPGEVVALLGHSGSGKSTLMRALTGMAPVTSGELRVAGRDVTALRGRALRSLRADVGHVFQHFHLVPRLSALANVLTGGLHEAGPASRVGVFSREQRVRALALLDRVGLADQARQQARTLSGGQQQRVAIARALMQDPGLILADEPVASLDPRLAGSVLGLLSELARERGVPVLVSLHVVALARRYTDRAVGLREGRVVADLASADLDGAAVREIYGADTEFGTDTDEPAARRGAAPLPGGTA